MLSRRSRVSGYARGGHRVLTGSLSDGVKTGLAARMSFDAENSKGVLKKRAAQIVANVSLGLSTFGHERFARHALFSFSASVTTG